MSVSLYREVHIGFPYVEALASCPVACGTSSELRAGHKAIGKCEEKRPSIAYSNLLGKDSKLAFGMWTTETELG